MHCYIYNTDPDLFRFEHSVFLEPNFFFHVNTFRSEVNHLWGKSKK